MGTSRGSVGIIPGRVWKYRGTHRQTVLSGLLPAWGPRADDLLAEACSHSPAMPSLSPLRSGPQLLWPLKRLNEPRSHGLCYCLWGGPKPLLATRPGPDVSSINHALGLSNLWSVDRLG